MYVYVETTNLEISMFTRPKYLEWTFLFKFHLENEECSGVFSSSSSTDEFARKRIHCWKHCKSKQKRASFSHERRPHEKKTWPKEGKLQNAIRVESESFMGLVTRRLQITRQGSCRKLHVVSWPEDWTLRHTCPFPTLETVFSQRRKRWAVLIAPFLSIHRNTLDKSSNLKNSCDLTSLKEPR